MWPPERMSARADGVGAGVVVREFPLQQILLLDHFQHGLGAQPGVVVARQGSHHVREQLFSFPDGIRQRGHGVQRQLVDVIGSGGMHGGLGVDFICRHQAGLGRGGLPGGSPGDLIQFWRVMYCHIT